MFDLHPLVILVIGIVTVVLMITLLRINAFIALITSAMVVSLLASGDPAEKVRLADRVSRVATEFGGTAGSIGIVIALAVVIGRCMMDSGAADRIVRGFLSLLGEKRSSTALMASGFVLAVPVFFDTVFYLLIPLARSMYRRTKKHYLKYAMAIVAGGVITHSLVPPTPGPLFMAKNLDIDIGLMIIVGGLVALPCAFVGLFFAGWIDRRLKIQMRPLDGALSEPEPLEDSRLPSLWISLLPVILPVLLISANTVCKTVADAARENLLRKGQILNWASFCTKLNEVGTDDKDRPARCISELLAKDVRQSIAETDKLTPALHARVETEISRLVCTQNFFADPVFARVPLSEDANRLIYRGMAELSQEQLQRLNWLMLEAAFPGQLNQTSRQKVASVTAVFGDVNLAMLISTAIAMWMLRSKRRLTNTQLAKVVEASLMSGGIIILITAAGGAFGAMLKEAQIGPAIEDLFKQSSGMMLLVAGAFIAAVMKIAQGSTTVAMITASAMVAPMVTSTETLGYHPVYLATAIGGGSMIGSWMNDSGFWVVVKMTGLTEAEGLKSWTASLAVVGFAAVIVSLLLATILPMA